MRRSRTTDGSCTLALSLALLAGACGGTKASTGAGGSGGAGGSSGAGGSTSDAGAGAGGSTSDAGAGAGGSTSDAAVPPSCASGGPGVGSCGAGHESCCTSLLVPGGTYSRTYVVADGGASDAADPATVGAFELDKYDVTVGRFRHFVSAVSPGDGGVGWRPQPGAGKHAHLGGGLGLVDVGADAGTGHELGWVASDDALLSPTDANLTSCGPTSTWSSAAGASEDRPINCITWGEAYAFCIWDGGFLPSEAEWELAAAGGSEQRAYPWGATAPGTASKYAIYDCNYPTPGGSCSSAANIAPVGTATLGAGRWGQLDLEGNLSQWNLDWYAVRYVSPCLDCAYASGGSSRILRGAQFQDGAPALLSSARSGNNPALRNDFIGIRCARSP
jgi:formylglycine-generating enzyme